MIESLNEIQHKRLSVNTVVTINYSYTESEHSDKKLDFSLLK